MELIEHITSKQKIQVASFSLLLLFLLFPQLIFQPNEFILSDGGDGLKNYFTFIHYIMKGSGIKFTGMNYPYGEHIFYTDNQFTLAYLFNKINFLFSDYRTLFLLVNYITLGSIPIGVYILYLILRKYKVEHYYALFISILIILQSPQFVRFISHYSLFYLFFVPLVWYQLLCFRENPGRLSNLLSLFIIGLLFTFLHLYYLLLFSLMVVLFSMINFPIEKNKKWNYTYLFLLPFVLGIGLIVFRNLTDNVIDRVLPYGLDTFHSHPLHLLFPMKGVVKSFVSPTIQYPDHSEGDAYLGMVMVFTLVIFLLQWILNKKIENGLIIKLTIITGLISFIFALGWHNYLFKEFLESKIPQLSQFRSLSRLAWITYYLLCIGLSTYLYQLLMRFKNNVNSKIYYAFLVILMLIWGLESQQRIGKKIAKTKEIWGNNPGAQILKDRKLSDFYVQNIDTSYQATLILPYFSVGSEKFHFEKDAPRSFLYGVKCVLDTEIPMMNGYLSRSSISQKMKQFQLFGSDLIEKEILQDLNQKPIAVLVTNQEELSAEESRLIEKCKFINQYKNNKLFSLMPSDLKSIKEISTEGSYNYYFDSLLDIDKNDEDTIILFDGVMPNADTNTYEFSIWIKIDTLSYKMPVLKFKQYNKKGVIAEFPLLTSTSPVDFSDGWLRYKKIIKITEKSNNICFSVAKSTFDFKNLMIRPINHNVKIEYSNERVDYNNYPIIK